MKITSGRLLVQVVDRRFGGLGGVDLDVVLLEHAGQEHARGLGVVHDQGPLCAHAPLSTRWVCSAESVAQNHNADRCRRARRSGRSGQLRRSGPQRSGVRAQRTRRAQVRVELARRRAMAAEDQLRA